MKLLLLDRPKDYEIIKGRDIQYFGPWAQPISTPEDLLKPLFEPYPTPESVYAASLRAINTTLVLLDNLADILPGLTGLNKTKRFWRIVYGHHLVSLAGIVEDIKNRHLSLPQKDYILGMPGNRLLEQRPLYSWKDAANFLYDDSDFRCYAAAIYLNNYYEKTELIEYEQVIPRIISSKFQDIHLRLARNSHKRLIKKALSLIFGSWRFHYRSHCRFDHCFSLIWDDYNLEDFDFKRLQPGVLFDDYSLERQKVPLLKRDYKKREMLKRYLPSPYGELLSLTIPLVALEGLADLIALLENKRYTRELKSIERVYSNGQAFNDNGLRRTLVALLAEEGKKIISIQHGGGGTYFANSGMFTDRIIADEYLSWGKGYLDSHSLPGANNIRSFPSVYLSNLRQKDGLANKEKKWDILLVALEESRHVKWLYSPLFPDMAYDYFNRQRLLFDFFSKNANVAIKLYPETHGWQQYKWLKSRYPSLKVLIVGKAIDYARESEITVIDYNSTAFLEMLAIKRPFLVTWNRRWFRGNELFEKFIDTLIEVGIFYEQPQDLVYFYNNKLAKTDLDTWWLESNRQAALEEMASNFSLTSDSIYQLWNLEFEK